MTGIVAGIGARVMGSALIGKAGGIFSAIPRRAWEALAVLGYVLALIALHQHYSHAHDAALVKATTAADNARWSKALDKSHAEALAWKGQADQLHARIAQDERKKHDEDIRLNAATADALRLRGPGAAAAHCGQGDHPGIAAAANRHDQAAAAAGIASDRVLAEDRAIVSWNWLVRIAQEHDDLLADKKAVIEADQKQRANWPH